MSAISEYHKLRRKQDTRVISRTASSGNVSFDVFAAKDPDGVECDVIAAAPFHQIIQFSPR